MATRKKKKTTKHAPARDPRITEEQHNEAVNTLRAEYYQGVRGIAEELIGDKSLKNRDDWETALHQAIDGSHWVIYTHANFQVLMCSDNHDAYSENYGQAPVEGDQVNWAAMAFAAMEQDVQQQLQAEGAGPKDDLNTPRRRSKDLGEQNAYGLTFAEWLDAAGGIGNHDPSMLRSAWLAGEDPSEYRAEARENGPRRRRHRR